MTRGHIFIVQCLCEISFTNVYSLTIFFFLREISLVLNYISVRFISQCRRGCFNAVTSMFCTAAFIEAAELYRTSQEQCTLGICGYPILRARCFPNRPDQSGTRQCSTWWKCWVVIFFHIQDAICETANGVRSQFLYFCR